MWLPINPGSLHFTVVITEPIYWMLSLLEDMFRAEFEFLWCRISIHVVKAREAIIRFSFGLFDVR
jgi:hypothetical protein